MFLNTHMHSSIVHPGVVSSFESDQLDLFYMWLDFAENMYANEVASGRILSEECIRLLVFRHGQFWPYPNTKPTGQVHITQVHIMSVTAWLSLTDESFSTTYIHTWINHVVLALGHQRIIHLSRAYDRWQILAQLKLIPHPVITKTYVYMYTLYVQRKMATKAKRVCQYCLSLQTGTAWKHYPHA